MEKKKNGRLYNNPHRSGAKTLRGDYESFLFFTRPKLTPMVSKQYKSVAKHLSVSGTCVGHARTYEQPPPLTRQPRKPLEGIHHTRQIEKTRACVAHGSFVCVRQCETTLIHTPTRKTQHDSPVGTLSNNTCRVEHHTRIHPTKARLLSNCPKNDLGAGGGSMHVLCVRKHAHETHARERQNFKTKLAPQ